MSKINVTFDTVTKACEITKDGQAVADVSNISMYRRYDYDTGKPSDKYSLNISSGWKDDANGTGEYHQLCAADNGDLVEVKAEASDAGIKAVSAEISKLISKALLKK